MPIADLDDREREVVRECLQAAVSSPFFPEWEFSTIFGLTREEVTQVLASWPDLNEGDESVVRAINNSFNNLIGLPGAEQGRAVAEVHFGKRHRACKDFRQVERPTATRLL
jgi:hypothetical protein